MTNKLVYLIGREVIKKGAQKGQIEEVIKRRLEYEQITRVSLRYVGSCPTTHFLMTMIVTV